MGRAAPCGRGGGEVETQWRGRHAILEEPRPAREVGKVEQRVIAAEPDLLGEERRVGRAGAAGEQRADIAEDRGAQPLGQLLEILVGDGEGEAVFARFGENEREALGGDDALLDLPNFAGWARLLKNGVPTSPLRLDLSPAPTTRRSSPHRLIDASRMRFGRPRSTVEARIRRFLAA